MLGNVSSLSSLASTIARKETLQIVEVSESERTTRQAAKKLWQFLLLEVPKINERPCIWAAPVEKRAEYLRLAQVVLGTGESPSKRDFLTEIAIHGSFSYVRSPLLFGLGYQSSAVSGNAGDHAAGRDAGEGLKIQAKNARWALFLPSYLAQGTYTSRLNKISI